ncbi:hypothetical protein ACIBKY_03255 [Nonomuraea sp. NPDC050394]|uniref:hypothetical protein n=1 Tax=Nonomuraea sp. NPDC050394 TaxID=3364363 RepID=UPI0037BC90B4
MIRLRRQREDTPSPDKKVCYNGQPATEIDRTADFVTVKLDDGTQPSVRPDRITTCTCGGRGCKWA